MKHIILPTIKIINLSKAIIKCAFLLSVSFLFTGCIGTVLLDRESDIRGDFISLRSVPERPKRVSNTKVKQLVNQQVKDYDDARQENQQLREEHGLSSSKTIEQHLDESAT